MTSAFARPSTTPYQRVQVRATEARRLIREGFVEHPERAQAALELIEVLTTRRDVSCGDIYRALRALRDAG